MGTHPIFESDFDCLTVKMENLKRQFEFAADHVQNNVANVAQDVLLELYGYYKQATCFGEFAEAQKPGFLDFKNKKKYASWEKASICSAEDSMERYIGIVKENFKDFKIEKTPENYSKKPSNILAKRVSKMAPIEQILKREPNSIQKCDEAKRTCLHWSVDREHLEVVEFLLSKTSFSLLNFADEDGCTALHYAATSENQKIVKILIKFGADPKICDNFGETPISIAPNLF